MKGYFNRKTTGATPAQEILLLYFLRGKEEKNAEGRGCAWAAGKSQIEAAHRKAETTM